MTKLKLKDNQITAALPEDIPQIAALTMVSMREAEIPVRPCYEKILITVTHTVINDICFVRRNKVNPKLIDGFILLAHRVPDYSLDSVLCTLIFYIQPEFRSFALARSLLISAQKYGIMVRLPLVFDIFTQKDAEKKKKLLTYLGFKEIGSFFVFLPEPRIAGTEEQECLADQLGA